MGPGRRADSEVCAAKGQYTSVAEFMLFLEPNYSRTESVPFHLISSVSDQEISKPELKARFRKAKHETLSTLSDSTTIFNAFNQ